MKRQATFKLQDTTVRFNGADLSHVHGPRNVFMAAQADVMMMQEGLHPTMSPSYLPDTVNDTAQLLIKEYGGRMIRPASPLKFDPEVIY